MSKDYGSRMPEPLCQVADRLGQLGKFSPNTRCYMHMCSHNYFGDLGE